MQTFGMDREAAAVLLGVPVDADPGQVRRAYRMWVRVAHPDAGGDPVHFARLTQARRTLLRPVARRPESPPATAPAPRAPLSTMVRIPARWPLLVIGSGCIIALAFLPRLGLSVPMSACIAGFATAAWAVLVTRASLRTGADTGHRIALHALIWLPLAAAITLVSLLFTTGFITMLPLLALPFAAVISWQNAGAGLWRPIGRQS
jgi:hypothetical protein